MELTTALHTLEHNELLQYFRRFHDIEDFEFEYFLEKVTKVSKKKGEYLCVPGQVQREVYFVIKGVQMTFFDSETKPKVISFSHAPQIALLPDSFFSQTPTSYSLQCLTESEFLAISYVAWEELLSQSQSMERLFRKLTEALLIGQMNRLYESHTLTIEERFRAFCKKGEHLIDIVPHRHIASYLNMDASSFNKLFNNLIS